MRIDLTSLSLFVTVAEERNNARAAARRNIAASAVSKRIRELEIVCDTAAGSQKQGRCPDAGGRSAGRPMRAC